MQTELAKNEFCGQTLLKMRKGDVLIVKCRCFNEYNSTATLARQFHQRKPDELKLNGVEQFKAEKVDEWDVRITAY